MGIRFRRSANVVLTVLAIAVPAAAEANAQLIPDSWSKAERWTSDEIRAGRIPDFNKRYREALDPKEPGGWDDPKKDRRLSQDFLKTILMREPFRSAVPDEGVRIIGAWLPENIDLADARLGQQLWLDKCRFDGDVNLTGATMDSLEVKSHLFMRDTKFDGDVSLIGAAVGSTLEMDGSSFKGVTMDSLEVKSNLFMRGANFEGDVNLLFAKVGSNLDLSGTTFHHSVVNLTGTVVRGL